MNQSGSLESTGPTEIVDQQLDALVANAIPGDGTAMGQGSEHGTDALPSESGGLASGFRLGAYRIDALLGQGGMGAVYRASHLKLGKIVALKVLPAARFLHPDAVKRFEREIQAVGRLNHPNVVIGHDAGEVDGTHFLVMELVEGEDLSKLAGRHGPLPVAEACEIIRQAALGLHHAHENGLVHRDLKPSNLILDANVRANREVRVKLLDLGLARLFVDDPSSTEQITRSGQVMGTFEYMPPEQACGEGEADERSDIYSLGATLYRLLTGVPPIVRPEHNTSLKKLAALATQEPTPIRELRQDMPDTLASLIHRMLARDPNKRPGSAADVAIELEPFARSANLIRMMNTGTGAASQTALPRIREPESDMPKGKAAETPRSPYSRRIFGTLGGLAAALLLCAIVIKLRNKDGNTTELGVSDGATAEITTDTSPSSVSGPSFLSPQPAGWRGWPPDAPKPAVAPFDAAQARKHQEEWAEYLKIPVEHTNAIGMKFVLIPPGEFLMGSTPEEMEETLKKIDPIDDRWQEWVKSEAPKHKVILTRPIYLGVTEVTQAEYEKVMGRNPSFFAKTGSEKQYVEKVEGMDTSRHPVEGVSWNDAAEFCAKLSQQEKLKPFGFRPGELVTPHEKIGYRLPTEAEWEFACRAGTTAESWYGDNNEDLMRVGWYKKNSQGRTHPAGELMTNPFGLADICGNVWEWVQDRWDPRWHNKFQDKPAIDPNGPDSGSALRMIRGGDWVLSGSLFRSSIRIANIPTVRTANYGFRVSLAADSVRPTLPINE